MRPVNKIGVTSVKDSVAKMEALTKLQINFLFLLKKISEEDIELFKAQYGDDKALIEALSNMKEGNLVSLMNGNNFNMIGSINLEMLKVLGQDDMHMSEFELVCESARI